MQIDMNACNMYVRNNIAYFLLFPSQHWYTRCSIVVYTIYTNWQTAGKKQGKK